MLAGLLIVSVFHVVCYYATSIAYLTLLTLTKTRFTLEVALNLRHRLQRLLHWACAREEFLSALVTLFNEQVVDFFQRELVCLGVAVGCELLRARESDRVLSPEEHQWNERKIQTHPNQVGLPLEVTDGRRTDHDDDKIPQPVRTDTDGGAFTAGVQWENLGLGVDRSATQDPGFRK